jgi:hypothetical protein
VVCLGKWTLEEAPVNVYYVLCKGLPMILKSCVKMAIWRQACRVKLLTSEWALHRTFSCGESSLLVAFWSVVCRFEFFLVMPQPTAAIPRTTDVPGVCGVVNAIGGWGAVFPTARDGTAGLHSVLRTGIEECCVECRSGLVEPCVEPERPQRRVPHLHVCSV